MRIKTIVLWALQILIGGMFVLVGLMKFQDPSWARCFARWGYPDGSTFGRRALVEPTTDTADRPSDQRSW